MYQTRLYLIGNWEWHEGTDHSIRTCPFEGGFGKVHTARGSHSSTSFVTGQSTPRSTSSLHIQSSRCVFQHHCLRYRRRLAPAAATLAQTENQSQPQPQRRLRVQLNGENHDTPTVLTGAAPGPASAPSAVGSPVQNGGVSATPGSSTTHVNVTPGTVNTNINFTPGTSTTTVSGVPATASAPAPAPAAAVAKPTSGMGFDLLSNPLSGVATLAHMAHGALLGHTGTLPSSYMQSNGQGGGHGH